MKSVVAASLIVGAVTLDSSSQCSGDNELQPPPGPKFCYKGPNAGTTLRWVTTVVELEEVNGDSGVLTLKGLGLEICAPYCYTPTFFECASLPYVRKGTRFIFEANLGTCSPAVPQVILDSNYEIEYCPDQDTFRFTERDLFHVKRSEFLQSYYCDGESVTV